MEVNSQPIEPIGPARADRPVNRPAGRLASPGAGALRKWLRSRLGDPLYRNGYALIASSVVTSALGLVYWLLAARLYPAAAVGVSAALISAMTLLANASQLNLKGALNRFLPRAGSAAGTFVVRSYAIALSVSAVAGAIFVAGIDIWVPRLGFLLDRPEVAIWFVLSTMAWTVFVLQDSVLAGIRQATWVPVENGVFSVAKIILLVALTAAAPVLGVYYSWSLSALLVVGPITLLLVRRLLPAHVKRTRGRHEAFSSRQVVGYAAPDFLAYLVWMGTNSVLPLIVLQMAGAEANAYFFVSWTIAYALYMIPSSMGMALIAEASLEPERLAAHTRRAVTESARLVVPAAAFVVCFASPILGLMGSDYSEEASTLLRLLALSAIPFMFVAAYANAMRVQQRMRAVVRTYVSLCAIVLALGIPLLNSIGIEGLGIAWLVGQSVVAAAVIASYFRRDGGPGAREELVRSAANGLRWARSLRLRLVSARARDAILERLRRKDPAMSSWGLHGYLGSFNDIAVMTVGPAEAEPVALIKRSSSQVADGSLLYEEEVLKTLNSDGRLGDWRDLIPGVIDGGFEDGRRFLVETRVPGTPAQRLLEEGIGSAQVVAATEAAIRPLHGKTMKMVRVDQTLLWRWVDDPIKRLRPVITECSRLDGNEQALERLRSDLRQILGGRTVVASFVHGDLSPGNILMTDDGAKVTGLVDWEAGQDRGLPQVDLMHLWMTAAMTEQQRELGAVAADLLAGWQTPGAEGDEESGKRSKAAFARAVVLLAWLHHASANVTKSRRFSRSGIWVHRNIDPVLEAFLPQPAPEPEPPAPSRPVDHTGGPAGRPSPAGREGFAGRAGHGGGFSIRSWIERSRSAPAAVLAGVAGLSAAMLLWIVALTSTDPRGMSEFGLLSVLSPAFFLAIALLTVSFAALVHRAPERTGLLATHLVALIALLHATPAIIYGTLRYSWAWKHSGIIDYIQRHGDVAPTIHALDVYHNWPGFFAGNALLNELAGINSSVDLAAWAPLFFNLLTFGALLFVFSALTTDRRIIWIGSWLFFIANWVGQDYFAPQAFAFFLYLVMLGVILRWLRTGPDEAGSRAFRWPSVGGWSFRTPLNEERAVPRAVGPRIRRAAFVLTALVIATITVTHALTSVMVIVVLAALVLSGICATRSLPFVALGFVALWLSTFASSYVVKYAGSTLSSINFPWATTESNLGQAGQFSDGQAVVAHVSRGLVVAIVALAVLGAIRQLRGGGLDRPPVVLAAAPVLLFASGDYDGELLFRIFLFMVPFLAFLGAHAYLPAANESRRSWRPAVVYAATGIAVLVGFLFAYYGKDRQYYFTPDEVAASEYLYEHAPDNSLLIQGTVNYPSQFKNYERFDYVLLAAEEPDTKREFLAAPADVLEDWMSNPEYEDAYVIITRSQIAEIEALGEMPQGSLERIRASLLASPEFDVVVRNPDAVVFTLARQDGES